MNGSLQVLRLEVQSDIRAFTERIAELGSVSIGPSTDDPNLLARVAVALHHAYGAFEAALARIARVFGTEPSGPNWHRSLLETMVLEVPGIRPAIVGAANLAALRDLLAFRHFFRHAYSVPLDPARLANLIQGARSVQPGLQRDFVQVDRWLAELAKAT